MASKLWIQSPLFLSKMQPEFILVNGFEVKGKNGGIVSLKEPLELAFPGHNISIFLGCPIEKSEDEPDVSIRVLQTEIRLRDRVCLIGYSEGALISLVAACREKLQKIEKLLLIEGPLHPRVKVAPPENGMFKEYSSHYRDRVKLTMECEKILLTLNEEKKAAIQTFGTKCDRIVPPQAKTLEEMGIKHRWFPDGFHGHDLKPKIDFLVSYIRNLLANPTRSSAFL